jgi:hypothetical protein
MFYRFHVAQHFGKAVDKVRAQENRWFVSNGRVSPLVKTKYELQRNSNRIGNRSRRDFMILTRKTLKTA